MSTLYADFENTPAVSKKNLRNTIGTSMNKLATTIGKGLVTVSQAIYEARKEEVRLRAYYHI